MEDKRIWVVDDDEVDLMTYKRVFRVLNRTDLAVIYFDRSGTMLDALKSEIERPELIFLDLNLPGLSGIEALCQIKQLTHTLPVVILSTSSSNIDVTGALKAGANAYFDKPIDFNRFSDMIEVNLNFWLDRNLRK